VSGLNLPAQLARQLFTALFSFKIDNFCVSVDSSGEEKAKEGDEVKHAVVAGANTVLGKGQLHNAGEGFQDDYTPKLTLGSSKERRGTGIFKGAGRFNEQMAHGPHTNPAHTATDK